MINLFVSIHQQLLDIGYNILYEGDKGFIYVKPLGSGYFIKAEYLDNRIKFFDPLKKGDNVVGVDELTLRLFAARIKEWRKKYECFDKSGHSTN